LPPGAKDGRNAPGPMRTISYVRHLGRFEVGQVSDLPLSGSEIRPTSASDYAVFPGSNTLLPPAS